MTVEELADKLREARRNAPPRRGSHAYILFVGSCKKLGLWLSPAGTWDSVANCKLTRIAPLQSSAPSSTSL